MLYELKFSRDFTSFGGKLAVIDQDLRPLWGKLYRLKPFTEVTGQAVDSARSGGIPILAGDSLVFPEEAFAEEPELIRIIDESRKEAEAQNVEESKLAFRAADEQE